MSGSAFDALLTEDQSMIADAVRDFATDVVLPAHEHLDHEAKWPTELWGQIAELGLFGTALPEDLGGAGAGMLGQSVVIESLARAGGLAGALAAGQGVVLAAMVKSGNDDAAGKWLESLATGELVAVPAMMENAPGECACEASGEGASVKVSGVKSLVPAPGVAGLYLVAARRGTERVLVAVEADTSGVHHGSGVPALGLSGYEVGDLKLDGAAGMVLGMDELCDGVCTSTQIMVASLLLGVAQGGIDHALRYSTERKQFKLELHRFGAIQERLTFSDTRTEALRGLVRGAAAAMDRGEDASQSARRARQFAAIVAPAAGDDAIQTYGGYGFSREYPAERFYRDGLFPGFGEYHHADLLLASTKALL